MRTYPVPVNMTGVLGGKSIVQLQSGTHHTLALSKDGSMYSWGYNNRGQLGISNTGVMNSYNPVAVDTSGVLSGKFIVSISVKGSKLSIATNY